MFVSSNLLKDLLPYFKRKLAKIYDEREIESIFFLSCFGQFNLSKIQVLNDGKRLSESELLTYRDIVERLLKHEPIQYILGQAEFYGLIINVSPSVLIPRPETEELVDFIVKDHSKKNSNKILDIGTGSGCIAIALRKNISDAEVFAVDISADAISVARSNALKNQAEVNFICADILKDELNQISDLDILVSNPPYIPDSDKITMNKNVLEHEPHQALFVEDMNPLIFYKRIIDLGKLKLKRGGKLYFEIHPKFSEEFVECCLQAGYSQALSLKDLSGENRFVVATK